MSTAGEQERLQNERAALIDALTAQLAAELGDRPNLGDIVVDAVDNRFAALMADDASRPPPADDGLAQLIGLGPGAAGSLDDTRLPERVAAYDDTVAAERIVAMGDLYYLFQHERIGVFRVIQKLKELFEAGAVRLSTGDGAYRLYRFDRREVLRYTTQERYGTYRRAFGYGSAPMPPGARPNTGFHGLFTGFNRAVAGHNRDKRISDVIRERASDPSFGSIATVRRAGLALRHDLKFVSYGNVSVLRVEVLQLLEEAFRIAGSDDVRNLFGAENAWDVIEEVLTRYFSVTPASSARQRMAVTGRNILRWLGQPFILEEGRTQFETKLRFIGDDAEEWLTSAASIGIAGVSDAPRPTPPRPDGVRRRATVLNGRTP